MQNFKFNKKVQEGGISRFFRSFQESFFLTYYLVLKKKKTSYILDFILMAITQIQIITIKFAPPMNRIWNGKFLVVLNKIHVFLHVTPAMGETNYVVYQVFFYVVGLMIVASFVLVLLPSENSSSKILIKLNGLFLTLYGTIWGLPSA